MATSEARRASRHASLRWLGIPLFTMGLLGLVGALTAVFTAGASWHLFGLYVAATGFSLGTFGLHNDTALAYGVRAGEQELSPSMRQELADEQALDASSLQGLSPSPTAALVITVLALGLHTLAATRLLQALG